SRQETHISQQSGSGTGEGTGSKPGVPDVPSNDSEEELSWKSSDDEEVSSHEKGKESNDDKVRQLKLITKRSLQQTHISQAGGSSADKGTGDDDEGKDGNGDEKDDGDDGEEGNGDDDDEDDDGEEGDDDDDEDDDGEEGGDDDQEFDEEEYTEETRDEESFDPIPRTPENNDDEGNGDEDLGLNIGREEGHVEEEEEDEL
nr:hypothetical protein [Tanacetum cinerariifolium]